LPVFQNRSEWESYAETLRQRVLEEIVFRGVPQSWRNHPLRVEWLEYIPSGPGYRLRKLRYEALPGLWIPALLYEPEKMQGKVPGVLNVNGHYSFGKQFPAKQLRCIHLARQGVMALNIEWVGMGQLHTPNFHHGRMNQLDLCGVSGLAVFFLNMQRGLDILLSLEHIDPGKLAVTGLSGGGWQTIVLSALDKRITLSNPVAGYSSYHTRLYHEKDLGDSEQTPTDLAALADYTHLTAFVAPRPLLLTYNAKDECCFEAGYALEPLVKAARPVYELYGQAEALRTHVNFEPGTHNYELDNRQAFYRMVREFFFANSEAFAIDELPAQAEIKSIEEMTVPLPAENHDFHTLALQCAASLPDAPALPQEATDLPRWQEEHRQRVADTIRYRHYQVNAVCTARENPNGHLARVWRLEMQEGDTTLWTMPAAEFLPANWSLNQGQSPPPGAKGRVLVSAEDDGVVASRVAEALTAGEAVLVIKPFGVKERSLGYLWHLLLAGVGSRTLGLQASEIAAACRWWKECLHGAPIILEGRGQKLSLATLLTAVVEPAAIDSLRLVEPMDSLQQILEENWAVTDHPEVFCFGLLQAADIPLLIATCSPRPVIVRGQTDRLRQQLQELKATNVQAE
jgi:dienelactone hydrolase